MNNVIKSPEEINKIMDEIVGKEIAQPAFIYAIGPMNFGLYNFNASIISFIAVYLNDCEKKTFYKDIVLNDDKAVRVPITIMSYDDWKEYGEYSIHYTDNYEIFGAYGKYELFWTNFIRWDEKINNEINNFLHINGNKLLEDKQTLRRCIKKYINFLNRCSIFFTAEQMNEAERSLCKINNLLTICDDTKIFETFNMIKPSNYGEKTSKTFHNLSSNRCEKIEIVDLQFSREKIEEGKIIRNRVTKHYKEMCKIYGEDHIMAILPFGSMNYGLFRKGKSDVDTKMIYVPSFEEALLDEPISKTHTILTEDGQKEFCTVKDIRLMKNMWLKGGFNFLEILFTKYGYVNPKYRNSWQFLQNRKNELIDGIKYNCIKSVYGEIDGNLKKAMMLKYKKSSNPDYVKHCVRADYLLEFLMNFFKGKSFEKAMIPFNADYLIRARNDVSEGIALYDLFCLTHMVNRHKEYSTKINQMKNEFQEERYKKANEMLRGWCIDVINHAL